jgi:hypothetical protein
MDYLKGVGSFSTGFVGVRLFAEEGRKEGIGRTKGRGAMRGREERWRGGEGERGGRRRRRRRMVMKKRRRRREGKRASAVSYRPAAARAGPMRTCSPSSRLAALEHHLRCTVPNAPHHDHS